MLKTYFFHLSWQVFLPMGSTRNEGAGRTGHTSGLWHLRGAPSALLLCISISIRASHFIPCIQSSHTPRHFWIWLLFFWVFWQKCVFRDCPGEVNMTEVLVRRAVKEFFIVSCSSEQVACSFGPEQCSGAQGLAWSLSQAPRMLGPMTSC